MALGDKLAAEEDLRRCLARNPGSPSVRALLADLARDRDVLRSGEHYIRSARRLDTSEPGVREILVGLTQPTAAVEKLPAATVAVGWTSSKKSSGEVRKANPTTQKMRKLAQGTTPSGKRPKLVRPKRFGEYLLFTGQLSKVQLQAALAYHRTHKVRLGDAVVALDFGTRACVDWAAHSFHEARARDKS